MSSKNRYSLASAKQVRSWWHVRSRLVGHIVLYCSEPSLSLLILGNRALVLLPHNHRRTCHLKSLMHPLLNPPALARGDPFTNGVDSGARVRNRKAVLDPSSKHQCKCNHHLGRLPTVRKLLVPGQLGKVSSLRHFFLSLKAYTRQQCNLMSIRRHQVSRRICHLKSLMHPLLNPPALARGDPFTNGVDSGARVRNRKAVLDPSSKHQCKCNHHLGRLSTVRKLLVPGQLGKVSPLRHFFLSLKAYTRQQCNLMSIRRHQVSRRICHLKSLMHPLLNPPALARGDPFTNGVDSGARVRNRRAVLDSSSKYQCKCNHHLGRLSTVRKLLVPGQLGKVSSLRHFFISLKAYTHQQCNLMSIRRHQVSPQFI
jgi:hypothetical protein